MNTNQQTAMDTVVSLRWAVTVILLLVWLGLLLLAWQRPLRSGEVTPESLGYQLRINHEPAARLQALHGIGPALADAVVEHRDAHGPFRHAAQLEDVPGIGPRKRARIEPWVSLD